MQAPPDAARLVLAEEDAQTFRCGEGIWTPSVPIESLIQEIAIVKRFSNRHEEGFCLERKRIWYVYINETVSKERYGYVCAHEMGHLRMGHLRYDQKKLTAHQVLQMKLEADYHADCMLMPADWLRSYCPKNTVTYANAIRLAQLFAVPLDIMIRRLMFLKIDCVINESDYDWLCLKKVFLPFRFATAADYRRK